MGTLNDRFQYVWYGTCGEPSCSELLFSSMSSDVLGKIDSVSTLENSGFVKYDPSSSETSTLDGFRCGKMYLVTLNHTAVASGGVEIPNALASSSISKLQGYGISTTCSSTTSPTPKPAPTPSPTTPTTVVCIPNGFTTVEYSSDSVITENFGTVSFNDEGKLAFNPSDFPLAQGLPRLLTVRAPDGFALVDVTMQAWPDVGSTPTVYFECTSSFCAGECYSGTLQPIAGTDNWEANLTL